MLARKKHIGTCHICGEYGELTFEHVPPHKAFNDRAVINPSFEQFFDKGPEEKLYGRIEQRGAGKYSLCAKCNNNTGAWYGNSFVDWVYQGAGYCIRTGSVGSFYLPFYIFPLRVIKQVLTMFFTSNGEGFRIRFPELVDFVLNPERKYINPSLRLYAYLLNGNKSRQNGISVMYRDGELISLSEIAFPPIGYVLTIDSNCPDERLTDITFFARYGYNDFTDLHLRLNKLEVNLYLPADYRTVDQIMEDYKRNTEFESGL